MLHVHTTIMPVLVSRLWLNTLTTEKASPQGTRWGNAWIRSEHSRHFGVSLPGSCERLPWHWLASRTSTFRRCQFSKDANDWNCLSDSLRPHNNESIGAVDIHSPNRAPWVSPWARQICESLGSCWRYLQRTSKICHIKSKQTRTCWNQSCPETQLVRWCGHLVKVSICQPKVTWLASGRRSQ